jgi:hypothetical protein
MGLQSLEERVFDIHNKPPDARLCSFFYSPRTETTARRVVLAHPEGWTAKTRATTPAVALADLVFSCGSTAPAPLPLPRSVVP